MSACDKQAKAKAKAKERQSGCAACSCRIRTICSASGGFAAPQIPRAGCDASIQWPIRSSYFIRAYGVHQ